MSRWRWSREFAIAKEESQEKGNYIFSNFIS